MKEQIWSTWELLIVSMSVALLTLISVIGAVVKSFQDDAVKHGHAEFYLDANNERQWRWKDNQPKP